MYAAKNAEILTCHEVKLTEISSLPGWSEFDGNAIWRSVLECIEISIKNLIILDINPADIVALGICNQRETTILWDSNTGFPVYNAIGKRFFVCIHFRVLLESFLCLKRVLQENFVY